MGSVTHENVFVTGSDGNLYLDYWNGTKWTWVNLGNGTHSQQLAGNQPVTGDPVVINYQVGSVTHENVFVVGVNGFTGVSSLYLDYWNGVNWTWQDRGVLGFDGIGDPAVINYQVGTVTHENVFGTGTDPSGNPFDDNLYWEYWNGTTWTRGDLGNPSPSDLTFSRPAVINYQVHTVTHENVFVVGSDGDLYLDYWNGAKYGAKWTWVNLGNGGSPNDNASLLPRSVADLPLTASAPGLQVAVVADQGASGSETSDSAIRQRLLLEDSPPAATAINESARRSPAVLGPKHGPALRDDLWSQDLARDALDW